MKIGAEENSGAWRKGKRNSEGGGGAAANDEATQFGENPTENGVVYYLLGQKIKWGKKKRGPPQRL